MASYLEGKEGLVQELLQSENHGLRNFLINSVQGCSMKYCQLF